MFKLFTNLFKGKKEALEVTIGNQIWMTRNLDVSTFRNGQPIPEANTEDEWIKASENRLPAWCYYNNDPVNGEKFGKLYNAYAVNDSRGICPDGWHIPSIDEWFVLVSYLGKESAETAIEPVFAQKYPVASALKSKRFWQSEIGVRERNTNTSGFSALPGGMLGHPFQGSRGIRSGGFSFLNSNGFWWSSTQSENPRKVREMVNLRFWLRFGHSEVGHIGIEENGCGLSVRCVKD